MNLGLDSRRNREQTSTMRLGVRCALQPIHDRRAESLRGNSFRNDKIETEHIELAQVAKKIRCRLSQILMRAQISNRDKFQQAAVSSLPLGAVQISLS